MAGHSASKAFILDTNVILHDPSCIHQFQENDIVIPLAVIEEIDRFKRGSQVINLNAREFARTLDSLTGNSIFNGGVPLGPGKGKVQVAISKGPSAEIREIFSEDSADNRILSIADEAQNLTPHEIKTNITRAGDGVKIVITGDVYQIDHPYLDAESNGLSYLIDRFKGQSLYGHINLEKGERSELAELASNLL
jgi:predicted ribonuclease YlaK